MCVITALIRDFIMGSYSMENERINKILVVAWLLRLLLLFRSPFIERRNVKFGGRISHFPCKIGRNRKNFVSLYRKSEIFVCNELLQLTLSGMINLSVLNENPWRLNTLTHNYCLSLCEWEPLPGHDHKNSTLRSAGDCLERHVECCPKKIV